MIGRRSNLLSISHSVIVLAATYWLQLEDNKSSRPTYAMHDSIKICQWESALWSAEKITHEKNIQSLKMRVWEMAKKSAPQSVALDYATQQLARSLKHFFNSFSGLHTHSLNFQRWLKLSYTFFFSSNLFLGSINRQWSAFVFPHNAVSTCRNAFFEFDLLYAWNAFERCHQESCKMNDRDTSMQREKKVFKSIQSCTSSLARFKSRWTRVQSPHSENICWAKVNWNLD